ncbi:MAG TPA: ATP-grasp domain-containing protein [Gaiellaceae bacterium]|nr:ATP-grasp domain-containing protein [Gaiellaceae bacterium]
MGRTGSRRSLLVLGAGPAQLGLLEAAGARGDLEVIALDRDPSALGFALADRRAIISTEDERGIERLAQAERIDGIVAPGIDWPVSIAARVADKVGIPHPLAPAVAGLAVSKARQREVLAEAGVPQPAWRLVAGVEEGLPVPCVVKAPDRQGQRGLSLVEDAADLRAAINRALHESRTGQALVEELADGPEVTVNAFSVGGSFHPLTVTDRLTADPPAFGVALAHVWPSQADAAGGAGEVAARAAEALGIADGPTYTQLRITSDGPQVLEVAARLGGGHDAELCEAALGVDLNGLALNAALGREIHERALVAEPRVGGAATVFLTAEPGELEAVEGVEEAEAAKGVLRVRVYRRPGSAVGELRRGADRVGAVQAVAATRAEALERARSAAALVRFRTARARAVL